MNKKDIKFLDKEDFEFIIKNTPLISIDLCVTNNNKLLIGKRLNEPAKYYYFVPGGRIYKNETINEAIIRICEQEIGIKKHMYKIEDLELLGIYEHFYTQNFFEKDHYNTHYIVMAYQINLNNIDSINKQNIFSQHSDLKWISVENYIAKRGEEINFKIHKYTKNYLKKIKI